MSKCKLLCVVLVLSFVKANTTPVQNRDEADIAPPPLYGGGGEHPELSKNEGAGENEDADVSPLGQDEIEPPAIQGGDAPVPQLVGGDEDVAVPPVGPVDGGDEPHVAVPPILEGGGPPGVDIGDIQPPDVDEEEEGIEDIEERPPVFINGNGEMDCIPASDNLKAFYHTCTIEEVRPMCYDFKCPSDYQECKDGNGTRYEMGSDKEWPETRDGKPFTCTCVWPGAVYWSLPIRPPGAPDFSAIKDCMLEGCEGHNNEFIRPGEEVSLSQDRKCRCVEGQDPMLADASTKYFLNCGDMNMMMQQPVMQDSATEIEAPDGPEVPDIEVPEITEPEPHEMD